MRFVDINSENYRVIIGLMVSEEQEKFVMCNLKALATAYAFRENIKAYGIEHDGHMVGMVMLRKNTVENTYFLWHLMVDKHYQNKGIGRLALEEVIRLTKSEGIPLVTTCEIDNYNALELYKTYGFKVFQEHEGLEVDLKLEL